MNNNAVVMQIAAQWLGDAEVLDRWYGSRAEATAAAVGRDKQEADEVEKALVRIRDALNTLARCGEAVPAETPECQASGRAEAMLRIDQRLHAARPSSGSVARYRRGAPPEGFRTSRLTRDSLLRLSVWRALGLWQETLAKGNRACDAFGDLLDRVAGGVTDVPPGIAPSLDFAASPVAVAFFNRQLNAALMQLGKDHPIAQGALARLVDLPPYDDTGLAVQRWGPVWTVAIFGVYLDWLQRRSAGDIEAAMADVWGAGSGTVRFKAPAGLAVLPTRERSMHIDLWTGLIQAQALAHQPERFDHETEGRRWHRVRLSMHDLGDRDRRLKGGRGMQTIFRGLSVEMIYQVVFADCLNRLLRQDEDRAMGSPTFPRWSAFGVPTFPPVCPGQQANAKLVRCWQSWTAPLPRPASRRIEPDAISLDMNPSQLRVLEAWRRRRVAEAGEARVLEAQELGWHCAEPDHCFRDEDGICWTALGRASLWSAIDPAAQWVDLAVAVHHQDCWIELPVWLHDVSIDGVLHTWLLADPGGPLGAELSRVARALGHGSIGFWAVHPTGLGAFVMGAVDLDNDATCCSLN